MEKKKNRYTLKSWRENFENNREWQKKIKKFKTFKMKNEMITRNLKSFQTFNDKIL